MAPHQQPLAKFFSPSNDDPPKKRVRRSVEGSSFGTCPLCLKSFPLHSLPTHASSCNGIESNGTSAKNAQKTTEAAFLQPSFEPIPGLFLFEDFITEEEEELILMQLDGFSIPHNDEFLPWKPATFNGTHDGKRWGVHCNLRDRRVNAAENPLPSFVQEILKPKLTKLLSMKDVSPNEANAIDYRRASGHYLASHVDDRKLSKEPIANLSLAGDCFMTFRNVAQHRNSAVPIQRVLLKRRCLQVLTGKARYDFSHGIAHEDLLSPRRVSVTMRESPLSTPLLSTALNMTSAKSVDYIKAPIIPPSEEPIPGLFVFHDFVTEEEERVIMQELDDDSISKPWKFEKHAGAHREKRFGVDHNLWSRDVRPPKQALPSCVSEILVPKLQRLICMKGVVINEANALDYRKKHGHSLTSHVDDRKKYKEPIANLSLCGECYMTYRNEAQHRNNILITEKRVLLKRRQLQVITGKARYDFSHGIANQDLLADRRVSLTMRDIPGL